MDGTTLAIAGVSTGNEATPQNRTRARLLKLSGFGVRFYLMAENPIDIRTGKPATDAEMRRRAKVADALRLKRTKPASGLPAMGSGWGGPARGSSATTGDLTVANAAPRRPLTEIHDDREKVLTLYREIIEDDAQVAFARIAAGDKLLDRIEGKAVARSITANLGDLSKLSDDELRAELARARGV